MRILFQGDSITDASRDYSSDDRPGIGYALLIKAHLGLGNPGEYECFNRGVGGNRIVDLYARIKKDIINIKPDIMSILIGVNDVWHDFYEDANGVDADKFYKIYDMLIKEIKEALPKIKIMIMEPFALKGDATEANWDTFQKEVKLRAEMSEKIAEEHNLTFIPLQQGFDELAKKAPNAYWLSDGVHPTPMGHEYIKSKWLEAFKML